MAGFLNKPLGLVSRVLQFRGAATPRNDFDVAGPIQPVYDLSRQSELGTRGQAAAGFLELGQTAVHVGATTIFAETDVYADFNSIEEFSDFDSGGTRQDRLWLLGVFATSGVDFTALITGILYNDPTRPFAVARWDLTDNSLVSAGELALLKLAASGIIEPPVKFPIYFPPFATWTSRFKSSNSVTTRVFSRWWAGPLGSTPPGMG